MYIFFVCSLFPTLNKHFSISQILLSILCHSQWTFILHRIQSWTESEMDREIYKFKLIWSPATGESATRRVRKVRNLDCFQPLWYLFRYSPTQFSILKWKSKQNFEAFVMLTQAKDALQFYLKWLLSDCVEAGWLWWEDGEGNECEISKLWSWKKFFQSIFFLVSFYEMFAMS